MNAIEPILVVITASSGGTVEGTRRFGTADQLTYTGTVSHPDGTAQSGIPLGRPRRPWPTGAIVALPNGTECHGLRVGDQIKWWATEQPLTTSECA